MPPRDRRYREKKKTGPDMDSWTEEEKRVFKLARLLETPVAEMELDVRVVNTLEENDIILVKDLMTQTWETLMGMKNFGNKTLREVIAAIEKLGLTPPDWKMPPKPKKIPKIGKTTKKDKNPWLDDIWS